ncbi:MAG TPA: iron ABC transporter permease [Solirubrobacterales bacterium]|nr:iron ABC transporter permease [Solirubrobacterales bacterium]
MILAVGAVLGLAFALPAFYLLVVVTGAPADAFEMIWRERTARLIARSFGLAAAVTAAAIAIAVPLAWLLSRTDLPGRRLWTVVAVMPLAIPSYIGAYTFISFLGPRGTLQGAVEPLGIERLPDITGFFGAWLVLTLFTYPLVLLPTRAALRRLDPSLEEAALGMGRTPREVFRTVVLPQLVPAIGAGAMLVGLYVLSDFGAVSMMRFRSFTTDIYTAYGNSFDRTGAAALAMLLMVAMLALMWVLGRVQGKAALYRSGPGTARPHRITELGRWRWPAVAACATVGIGALVLPVTVLIGWSVDSVAGDPDWAAIASAAGNSIVTSGTAALIAVVCALPIAYLVVRHRGPATVAIERLSFTGYALPGIVVALSLVFFGTRAVTGLYQTEAMVIFAFVVLFVPLAITAVRSALAQTSPRLGEAARSTGRGPLEVFWTVTVPLTRGGLVAGAALVGLTAVKELPATLLLAPIGFSTLATETWQATQVGFFERGAIPALILLLVSIGPLYLLLARDHWTR